MTPILCGLRDGVRVSAPMTVMGSQALAVSSASVPRPSLPAVRSQCVPFGALGLSCALTSAQSSEFWGFLPNTITCAEFGLHLVNSGHVFSHSSLHWLFLPRSPLLLLLQKINQGSFRELKV